MGTAHGYHHTNAHETKTFHSKHLRIVISPTVAALNLTVLTILKSNIVYACMPTKTVLNVKVTKTRRRLLSCQGIELMDKLDILYSTVQCVYFSFATFQSWP